jgi:hypothetical protein
VLFMFEWIVSINESSNYLIDNQNNAHENSAKN